MAPKKKESTEEISPIGTRSLMDPKDGPMVLDYSPEFAMKERLKMLIFRNLQLPAEARSSKYELLLEAGYPEIKARALADILVEGDKETRLKRRGFDENSAKKVISDIAHDETIKPDVRLKAAEDMLKVLGVFRDNEGGSEKTSGILAQLLSDIFHKSESRPKIVAANIIEQLP
jgi:hypothetical protein